MKKPYNGNFQANPILLERYLPGIYGDTFSMKFKTKKSCYVFMELMRDEDGRLLKHFLDIEMADSAASGRTSHGSMAEGVA
jgi:hypothetical protein